MNLNKNININGAPALLSVPLLMSVSAAAVAGGPGPIASVGVSGASGGRRGRRLRVMHQPGLCCHCFGFIFVFALGFAFALTGFGGGASSSSSSGSSIESVTFPPAETFSTIIPCTRSPFWNSFLSSAETTSVHSFSSPTSTMTPFAAMLFTTPSTRLPGRTPTLTPGLGMTLWAGSAATFAFSLAFTLGSVGLGCSLGCSLARAFGSTFLKLTMDMCFSSSSGSSRDRDILSPSTSTSSILTLLSTMPRKNWMPIARGMLSRPVLEARMLRKMPYEFFPWTTPSTYDPITSLWSGFRFFSNTSSGSSRCMVKRRASRSTFSSVSPSSLSPGQKRRQYRAGQPSSASRSAPTSTKTPNSATVTTTPDISAFSSISSSGMPSGWPQSTILGATGRLGGRDDGRLEGPLEEPLAEDFAALFGFGGTDEARCCGTARSNTLDFCTGSGSTGERARPREYDLCLACGRLSADAIAL
mmetsp:Transcript_5668/g.16114  ORF Transcript_5668/g.16114 Transcript_5668/m.16114 type:complete len:472 (-) Transcript_5668:38-1453(-)